MARIMIYTTPVCPYCAQAKRLLGGSGVGYDEIDVASDGARRAEMVERTGGLKTVPQIFIDGKHLGGYAELRAVADAGGLSALG